MFLKNTPHFQCEAHLASYAKRLKVLCFLHQWPSFKSNPKTPKAAVLGSHHPKSAGPLENTPHTRNHWNAAVKTANTSLVPILKNRSLKIPFIFVFIWRFSGEGIYHTTRDVFPNNVIFWNFISPKRTSILYPFFCSPKDVAFPRSLTLRRSFVLNAITCFI